MKSTRDIGVQGRRDHGVRFLEWAAGSALLAVLAALSWVILVAYQPDALRFVSVDLEAAAILAILITALTLVSLLALIHTRAK